jgi:hypothetical protein
MRRGFGSRIQKPRGADGRGGEWPPPYLAIATPLESKHAAFTALHRAPGAAWFLRCRPAMGDHDGFFKRVFRLPEHAAGELLAVLRPEVASRIDLGSLELVPLSFVAPPESFVFS